MSEVDGKSLLLGGEKRGSVYVADLHDIDEQANRDAAEACPMRIIRIEKSSNKQQGDGFQRLRNAINKIDRSIVEHLAQRMDLVRELGKLKQDSNSPVVDKKREQILFARLADLAQEYRLSPAYIHDLWEIVLRESIREQEGI